MSSCIAVLESMAWMFAAILVLSLTSAARAEMPQIAQCKDLRYGPAAASFLEDIFWEKVDYDTEEIFSKTRRGLRLRKAERDMIREVEKAVSQTATMPDGSPAQMEDDTHGADTYGEATEHGVRQIGRLLGLDVATEPVVFADIGSGLGCVVMRTYMQFPAVKIAKGVELFTDKVGFCSGGTQEYG
eukprot:TRINITY_DN14855_c0_g1_i2.p1 TRINITY_DN14855_c0_g1~~TRINITY_DN14855_c0_g1_i2.p1  ORF type:complete len:186 (+),score=39.74 TRINITY_DN14855_c0_g1_i2:57-614(+)